MKKTCLAIVTLQLITCLACSVFGDDQAKIVTLEKRVNALEKELSDLKASIAPVLVEIQRKKQIDEQRTNARNRMRKDRENYSSEELQKIEELYQSANRNLGTPEAEKALKEVVDTYPKANRAGCALMYLGQSAKGKTREEIFTRAMKEFGDCYYGDGVRVGAYARYYLAYHYKEIGEAEKSAELFRELKEKFPGAINHKGKLLADLLK